MAGILKIVDGFLTSGYKFSGNQHLQQFRFSLLNSLLIIASFFTLLNYFASKNGFVEFSPLYEKTLLFYVFACLFSIYILRKDKAYYPVATNIVVLSSLVLFYCALFVVLNDEFRLVWFFLVVFASFVLMGKKYGLILMLCVLASIILINQRYDLGFSRFAQFTFFNSFLIFTAFAYFFLQKIEKDALEFTLLNNRLKQKVAQETHQREEHEQMLLRQCRMANMGEMLDSIAHQWRQPLMHINAILLNMDNALESENLNKNYLDRKVDEISSLTAHMSQTIEDFRDLFKTEKERTRFTLKGMMNDVLALMKNTLHGINIEYTSGETISVLGYKSELIQIIIILLSNAIEALNSRDIRDKKITISIKKNSRDVTISIEDNAGGIPAEDINRIFDPYMTTKEQSGGTGLGLYIAKIIVEHKMSGEINTMNTANGARFIITLREEDVIDT